MPWRRLALDWVAPLGIVAVGAVNVAMKAGTTDYPGSGLVHLAFLTAAAVALGLRRRAPIAAPLLDILIVTVWAAGMWPRDAQGPFEGFLLVVGASYCIASGNTGRRLVQGSGLLMAYFVVSQVVLFFVGGGVGDLLPVFVWMVAAWTVGFVLNRRVQQTQQARQSATALVADHERRTAEAVGQERSRIARELHDVVAHSLSVIVVQAAAERRALAQGRTGPESTEAVLDSVERTGREALVDLRRMLGLLRQLDERPTLAPQPSLRQLENLLDPVRQAGLAVDVHSEGVATEIPTGVDLSAYRIVQEALTNVVKHAGATRVVINLCYSPSQLTIVVGDDGSGHPEDVLAGVGGGHGLIGMRERAVVFGGTLQAGPSPVGGWEVRARLPLGTVPEPR